MAPGKKQTRTVKNQAASFLNIRLAILSVRNAVAVPKITFTSLAAITGAISAAENSVAAFPSTAPMMYGSIGLKAYDIPQNSFLISGSPP